MNKPKVLYLSDSDLSKPGGAQQSMKVLAEGLKSEFNIYVLSPKGDRLFENHVVINQYKNFVLRGKSKKQILLMIKDLYFAIRKIDPDIIHVQMTSTLIIINILLRIGLLKNIKLIYTDRGVYSKYKSLTKKSINSFIKYSNQIITTTNVNKNNYAELFEGYSKYKHKFAVIYNTAGREFDVYNRNKRFSIRKKLKIKDESYVIGLCGRYSEQKNWPLAKEILDMCSKYINNISVVLILGTDMSNEENNKAKLFLREIEEIVGKENFRGYINLNNKEVSDCYYAFDCFLLTSKWESFGRTAVEAMSRKNIVIGTEVDGLVEVIGDKKFLYNCAKEAVEAISLFAANRKEQIKASDYFFEKYHNNYNSKKNINSYKEIYYNTLK